MTLLQLWSELMDGVRIRRKNWSKGVWWQVVPEIFRKQSVITLIERNSYLKRKNPDIPFDYFLTDDWERVPESERDDD